MSWVESAAAAAPGAAVASTSSVSAAAAFSFAAVPFSDGAEAGLEPAAYTRTMSEFMSNNPLKLAHNCCPSSHVPGLNCQAVIRKLGLSLM